MLNTDDYFDNGLVRMLFKAFVYAEARFICNYIPQNSHEERLTGHLISEYLSALGVIQKAFQAKACQIYKEHLSLEFSYVDLSSYNREKTTGADFGIMFHINLPDYPEEIRTAIFQAKKLFKASASIDVKQCNVLKNYGEEGAHYCFYDMKTEATSSPLVLPADCIALPSDPSQNTTTYSREALFDNREGGIPLSLFLIWYMFISEDRKRCKVYKDIWQAKNYFDGGGSNSLNREANNPSRLLIVSIGGLTTSIPRQELKHLSQLYRFPSFEE